MSATVALIAWVSRHSHDIAPATGVDEDALLETGQRAKREHGQLRADLERVTAEHRRCQRVRQLADSRGAEIVTLSDKLERVTKEREECRDEWAKETTERQRLEVTLEHVRSQLSRLAEMKSWDSGRVYCAQAVDDIADLLRPPTAGGCSEKGASDGG